MFHQFVLFLVCVIIIFPTGAFSILCESQIGLGDLNTSVLDVSSRELEDLVPISKVFSMLHINYSGDVGDKLASIESINKEAMKPGCAPPPPVQIMMTVDTRYYGPMEEDKLEALNKMAKTVAVLDSSTLQGIFFSASFTQCEFQGDTLFREVDLFKQFRSKIKEVVMVVGSNPKIGIQFDLSPKRAGSCLNKIRNIVPLLQLSDSVMFYMTIEARIYSYQFFEQLVDKDVGKAKELVREVSPNCEIVLLINPLPIPQWRWWEYPKDFKYREFEEGVKQIDVVYAEYAFKWGRENNMKVIVDLKYNLPALHLLVQKRSKTVGRDGQDIPWWKEEGNVGVTFNPTAIGHPLNLQNLETPLKLTKSVFQWLLIPSDSTELAELIPQSSTDLSLPLIQEVKLVAVEKVDSAWNFKTTPDLDRVLKNSTITGVCLEVEVGLGYQAEAEWDRVKHSLQRINHEGLKAGLKVKSQDFSHFSIISSNSLEVDLDFIVWSLSPDLLAETELRENFEQNLLPALNQLLQFRQEFQNHTNSVDFNVEVGWQNSGSNSAAGVICQGFNTFWEILFTWAKIHSFGLIVDNAFDNNEWGVSGWWKMINREDPADESAYIARVEDPCVRIDTISDLTKRIPFNSDLAGVTLNPAIRADGTLTPPEYSTMLDITTKKFRKIELSWEYLCQGFRNSEFQTVMGEHVKVGVNSTTKYYLSITPPPALNELQNCVTRIAGVVTGVHIASRNATEMSLAISKLGEIKRSRAGSSFQIGAFLSGWKAYNPRFNEEDISRLKAAAYLSQVDYIIWDADIGDPGIPRWILERLLIALYDELRRIRISIKRLYPNIQNIMVRLTWVSGWHQSEEGPGLHETVANFLRFWASVNELGAAYGFPFFIFQAFDKEVVGDFENMRNGWWHVVNYTDLSDPASYLEKEKDFLGIMDEEDEPDEVELEKQETLTTPPSPWLVYTLVISIIALFAVFGATVVVQRRRLRLAKAVLTKHEVDEFFNGGDPVEGNAVTLDLLDDAGAEVIMRLKYNMQLEIPKAEFRMDSKMKTLLGKGNFGVVYKTIVFRFEEEVAVKMPLVGECSKQALKGMLSEIKIMSYVGHHNNVLQLLGAYTKEIQDGRVYVVTQLCSNGSLESHLRNLSREGSPTNRMIQQFARYSSDIALGMEYISGKRVIHGDLSSRNILLDGALTCKISDFGLSRKMYKYEMYVRNQEEPLPWRWLAPECLKRLQFSTRSDVWAYGVTLWEIFTLGEVPYTGLIWDLDFVSKLADGMRLKCPQFCPKELYDIMMACWNEEVENRPLFGNVVESIKKFRGGEYTTVTN